MAEVLAPVTAEEFAQSHLGKRFQYLTGHPGKFASLLTWPDLNQILRHHQLDVPRLRLIREGKGIPAESFISYRASHRGPSPHVTQLRSADLTNQLREGATLVLDSMDEFHEPITELAENFEKSLRARIQVNMYAGWRTSPGFDVHWDGHDVFILQVSGRKLWKVYPMTCEHPLPGDPKTEEPPKDPLWEGMLNDGDALYIPRGWWHVAVPLDEPTLHLTVGVHQVTGVDFLSWCADRLSGQALIRKDLPRLGTASEKDAHLRQMRAVWEQAWDPGLLDEYFDYIDGRTRPRPHFALPVTAEAAILPAGETGWFVKWMVPRSVELNSNGQDTIVVRGNGKESTFAAAARPVLEALSANGTCSLDQLLERAGGTLPREQLRIFLKELVNAGLVSVVLADDARGGQPEGRAS